MKYIGFLICCSFLLLQCAKPIAGFNYSKENHQVPATINFENASQNADSYTWIIDDSITIESNNLTYDFYNSGRHRVELKAIKDGRQSSYSSELIIAAPNYCTVKVNTTEGAMLFELFEDTPLHLANFINLAEKDFYNNLIFHRVIAGFMIQAGEKSKEYKSIDSDHLAQIPQEINSQQLHYKGALAAARMPDNVNPKKSSSGLQFYIVQGRTVNEEQLANYEASRLENFTEEQKQKYLSLGGAPQLDGEYTVFGNMLSGFDVLNKIASTNTDKNDRPHEEIRIINIEILN